MLLQFSRLREGEARSTASDGAAIMSEPLHIFPDSGLEQVPGSAGGYGYLGLAFRRSDDGEDPPEWAFPIARRGARSRRRPIAFCAMRSVSLVLMTTERLTCPNSRPWIDEVRALSKTRAREEIGDSVTGDLFSKVHPVLMVSCSRNF